MIQTKSIIAAIASFAVGASAFAQTSVEEAPAPSNIQAFYANYTLSPAFKDSDVSSILHYIGANYKLGGGWKVGGVFRFDTAMGGAPGFDNTLGDSYVRAYIPSIKAGGVSFSPQLRYYAPMSQASQDAKLAGIIQPRVYQNYNAGPLEIAGITIPRFYLNTFGEPNQTLFRIGQYAEAGYRLSANVKPYVAFFPEWRLRRDTSEMAFNDLVTDVGVSIDITQKFSVSPYVEFFAGNPKAETTNIQAFINYTIL